MDILENDPSPPPLGGGAKVLIGALAALAVTAGAAIYLLTHDRPTAAPEAADSTAEAPWEEPEAFLIGAHVNIGAGYTINTDGREFMLIFNLNDQDGTRPLVGARPAPKLQGFPRLAIAVLPGSPEEHQVTFAEVAAATHRQTRLGAPLPAHLYLAGAVDCEVKTARGYDIDLRINGEQQSTALPDFSGKEWSTAVLDTACDRTS